MRTISACLVLLLSLCAIVNTQLGGNTTASFPCFETESKTDTGISYRIKCGACKNINTTISFQLSQNSAELSMNSMCTNCTSGTPKNKTCTIKATNANDTSFIASCYDYSSTCSTAQILSLQATFILLALSSM